MEALLLRSSRSCEPPPLAQEEVGRRIQLLTGKGVALGANGIAGQAASTASSRIAAGTLWPAVFKWTAVIAFGLPAAGGVAHWAARRESRESAVVTQAAPPPSSIGRDPLALGSPSGSAKASIPAAADLPDAPGHGASRQRVHRGAGAGLDPQDAPSALRKESLSLAEARAKFASGDPRAALDKVASLSVEFPHGKLAQEREALAIDCLAALGDAQGARARAQAFVARFPGSPYLARIRPLATPCFP